MNDTTKIPPLIDIINTYQVHYVPTKNPYEGLLNIKNQHSHRFLLQDLNKGMTSACTSDDNDIIFLDQLGEYHPLDIFVLSATGQDKIKQHLEYYEEQYEMATKKQTTSEVEILTDDKIAKVDERALELQAIDSKYGESLPYQKERIIAETKQHLNNSAMSMIEAGKRLIQLKEHEGHGSFILALDEIGLNRRVANRFMNTALKVGSLPNGTTLSHLPASKIYEIATLDQDDVQALADGETVAGVELDDIDKMTVRELKSTLREHKANSKILQDNHEIELDTKDKIIAKKDTKINDLDIKLEKLFKGKDWRPQADNIIQEISKISTDIIAGLTQLDDMVNIIESKQDNPELEQACKYSLEHLQASFENIAHNGEIVFNNIVTISNDWSGELHVPSFSKIAERGKEKVKSNDLSSLENLGDPRQTDLEDFTTDKPQETA